MKLLVNVYSYIVCIYISIRFTSRKKFFNYNAINSEYTEPWYTKVQVKNVLYLDITFKDNFKVNVIISNDHSIFFTLHISRAEYFCKNL